MPVVLRVGIALWSVDEEPLVADSVVAVCHGGGDEANRMFLDRSQMISRVAEAKFDKDNTETLLRLTKWFDDGGTDG